MGGMPIHPAIVHIPIGLAVVTPVLAGAVLVALWRGRADRRTWGIVALVQAIVLAGALVALQTGRAEEERVEEVAPEAAIEMHEERAEVFTWLAGLSLATGVAVLLVPGRKAILASALAATMTSAAVAGATWWVGHSGGSLVYQHGAALAYAGKGPGAIEGGHVDDD